MHSSTVDLINLFIQLLRFEDDSLKDAAVLRSHTIKCDVLHEYHKVASIYSIRPVTKGN